MKKRLVGVAAIAVSLTTIGMMDFGPERGRGSIGRGVEAAGSTACSDLSYYSKMLNETFYGDGSDTNQRIEVVYRDQTHYTQSIITSLNDRSRQSRSTIKREGNRVEILNDWATANRAESKSAVVSIDDEFPSDMIPLASGYGLQFAKYLTAPGVDQLEIASERPGDFQHISISDRRFSVTESNYMNRSVLVYSDGSKDSKGGAMITIDQKTGAKLAIDSYQDGKLVQKARALTFVTGRDSCMRQVSSGQREDKEMLAVRLGISKVGAVGRNECGALGGAGVATYRISGNMYALENSVHQAPLRDMVLDVCRYRSGGLFAAISGINGVHPQTNVGVPGWGACAGRRVGTPARTMSPEVTKSTFAFTRLRPVRIACGTGGKSLLIVDGFADPQ